MYMIVVIGGLVAITLLTSLGIFTVLFAISVIVWLPDELTEDGEANKVIATPQTIKAIKTAKIIVVFFSIILPINPINMKYFSFQLYK